MHAPNSQFRLVLSVTPCMSRTSSLESVNRSTSPLLFSSTSSPTYVPTSDSPKDQLPPSPSSSTNSLTSFHTCKTSSQHDAYQALSPELFSPTPISSTYVHNSEQVAITPPLPQWSPRIRRRCNYTITQAFHWQVRTRMCVAVLVLPHFTPQLQLQ